MKTPKTVFFFFVTMLAVTMFASGIDAQEGCVKCSGPELANGACTEITYLDGTPTGYVVRLAYDSPKFEVDTTTFSYEVCLLGGTPAALSHADLEFKICSAFKCYASTASVNDNSFTCASGGKCEQIPAGTGGDPSSGYGDDLASDIVKIELGSLSNGSFSVTVDEKAFATLGKIGFKAGTSIMVGEILQPVCSDSCATLTFADFTETRTLKTKNGAEFTLKCNQSTGCCEVTKITEEDGTVVKCDSVEGNEIVDCKDIRKRLGNFLATNKTCYDDLGTEIKCPVTQAQVVGEKGCGELVGEDDSDGSVWYCSGGWCY